MLSNPGLNLGQDLRKDFSVSSCALLPISTNVVWKIVERIVLLGVPIHESVFLAVD